jgi:hypothetical protein
VHVESTAYPTVTDERLQHPEAGDWLMYRRTYDGWGFSPLNEITSSNIQKLSLAWSMSTDLLGAHETTAILNHGRMFMPKALELQLPEARKRSDGPWHLEPIFVYFETLDFRIERSRGQPEFRGGDGWARDLSITFL